MSAKLLQHTPDPIGAVAQAARLCYSAVGIDAITERLTQEKAEVFVSLLLELGHLSPFEHASFTFGIEGVSRALTHQLVRHRLASYSQQSQRYVAMRNFCYIVPPSIATRTARGDYHRAMVTISDIYDLLLQAGVPAEDARYILPNACETKIIVTMNARELLHFFSVRCCNRAQWEIRALADEMLALVKTVAAALFRRAGPPCAHGRCTEGGMSCGRQGAQDGKDRAKSS